MSDGEDAEDGFTKDNGELAGCALVNLENVARMVPGLAEHPMYKIAHMQAKALSIRLLKSK